MNKVGRKRTLHTFESAVERIAELARALGEERARPSPQAGGVVRRVSLLGLLLGGVANDVRKLFSLDTYAHDNAKQKRQQQVSVLASSPRPFAKRRPGGVHSPLPTSESVAQAQRWGKKPVWKAWEVGKEGNIKSVDTKATTSSTTNRFGADAKGHHRKQGSDEQQRELDDELEDAWIGSALGRIHSGRI